MALSNSQYDAIMRVYNQRQFQDKREQDKRIAEVYEKIPQVEALSDEIAATMAQAARKILAGNRTAADQLKKDAEFLKEQKAVYLKQNGYPANYLELQYVCPDCKDTGYIEGDNGLRKKCHCFHQQELDILYEQSHIRDMIASENFSNLSYEYYQGDDLTHFRKCVDVCRNFVQNFKQDYHNLFFYGTVGTGKSFLSGCIASELLQTGHSVIYFSASGLFDTLARYAFDSRAKEALSGFYEDLYNCDLLIIGDLGTEMTNTFVASQLFSCLNERHLRKNSTIISTNLSLEELRDRYSDRVFSRITSHYDLCKLTGPDIRMYKKRMQNISDN